MNLLAAPVTMVAATSRREGWRGVLREGKRTMWRCECAPHPRPELAAACAREALERRGSGYYAGSEAMNEWLPVPQTDEERHALVEAIKSLPAPIDTSFRDLMNLREQIKVAESYEEIRSLQGSAEGVRLMWLGSKDIRQEYERTFLTGEWRIGQALVREEEEVGKARGVLMDGRDVLGRHRELRPNDQPTITEKVGNRTHASRYRIIAPLDEAGLYSVIDELHQADKQATLTGVAKILRGQESEMRRLDSMTAPSVNSMDLRVGDCRLALTDIEADSIPLIMTDPPYEESAEPLWRWLAAWAETVLIPGGSLICYFGGSHINRLYRILDDAGLKHHWPCAMMHQHAQRLAGPFVIASHKPILWYVKEYRRGRSLVPDVVYSARRNKAQHAWGQGEGGVTQWIHQLTEPDETIVDPFCGTGEWGLITCREGRRWIGCDIVAGGTTTVVADDPEDSDG
jgi:hypothetical protein